jgi:hypothetical protein
MIAACSPGTRHRDRVAPGRGACSCCRPGLPPISPEGCTSPRPETAFYEIAQRAGGAWLKLVVIVAVVIASAIANAMAAQAAVARILFAMARDGKLPAVLAKVHPRFKTPYISTLVVAGVSVLVGSVLFSKDRRSHSRRELRRFERVRAPTSVGHQSLFSSGNGAAIGSGISPFRWSASQSFSTCCTKWIVRRRFSAPAGSPSAPCITAYWRCAEGI